MSHGLKMGPENLGESVAPQSIQPIIQNPKKVAELLRRIEFELNHFKKSVAKTDSKDFINHYRNKIKKKLEKEKLFENYREHMKFYARMADTKLVSITTKIDIDHKNIIDEIEKSKKKGELIQLIRKTWQPSSRKELAKKQQEKIREFFVELFKMSCKHLSTYCYYFYESFFVIEYNCKLIAGMGCYRFAKKIAKSNIINHSEVLKTIKNLSGKNKQPACDHCFTKETCNFQNPFRHLGSLYSGATKLRILSDYSEIFSGKHELMHKIVKELLIPTAIEIHKYKEYLVLNSKLMWSPITDRDLGIG